jgi:hypothetical protein
MGYSSAESRPIKAKAGQLGDAALKAGYAAFIRQRLRAV